MQFVIEMGWVFFQNYSMYKNTTFFGPKIILFMAMTTELQAVFFIYLLINIIHYRVSKLITA